MVTPNLHLKARDLISLVAVPREYSVLDLSILIHTGTFCGMAVIESGNLLIGMVTEFDILKALVEGRDLHTLKAENLMPPNPLTVEESATAEDFVKRMVVHQIIWLPVVRDGKLLGMISRTNLMNNLIDHHIINVCGG